MVEKAEDNRMVDVVGVCFKRTGRVYYFEPSDIELKVGDYVVVETARGLELGEIVVAPAKVPANEVDKPLKPVVRKANDKDIKHADKLEKKEGEALAECDRLIDKLKLPMKLISVEYNLDASRLTVFFSAEGRVDFRELVRELSYSLKVRIEMRQVGPRDEAKLLGGFGRCGLPLCCASFLREFNPVSIKMAKEQELPLNPMKISGLCGRLLCCLGYEFEQYRAMKEKMPKEGQRISTTRGMANVVGSNPLEGTVLVELESGARVELSLDEITDNGKDKSNHKRKDTKK
jgi:cell fate regulator YaaT (PSP1 superfamily)